MSDETVIPTTPVVDPIVTDPAMPAHKKEEEEGMPTEAPAETPVEAA